MRAPLGMLLAGVCGLGCSGLAKTSDSMNGGGTGGSGGSSSGSSPCAIAIAPVGVTSFDGLVAGADARLRVRGEIIGTPAAVFSWVWRATFADGTDIPVARPNASEPAVVELPLPQAGTYTIDATLEGEQKCVGQRTVSVLRPGGRLATFRLRVTPAPALGVPAQDFERQVAGGTPSGGNLLPLVSGIVVPLDVRSAGTGTPLPAYVRLTEVASGAVTEAHAPGGITTSVQVAPGSYELLIVPEGDVAPMRFPARPASALATSPVSMDDGVAVPGRLLDAAGAPIAGATVVLRAGSLSSTRAISDARGDFQVRVRPGTFGVTVALPIPNGTLAAALSEVPGVTVADGRAPPTLAVRMAALGTARTMLDLRARSAASLGSGARVTLEAAAPLARVATLDAGGGGAPLAMTGQVLATLRPAADGSATAEGLLPGRYRVTVYPAGGDTADAVTTQEIDVGAAAGAAGAAVAALRVQMAGKVSVRGTLSPAAGVAGVRLLALDEGGFPITATADADTDGRFQIAVSPLRRYLLRALPRPGQPLARAIFPPVTVSDGDVDVEERVMPRALPYTGRVVDPSQAGAGATLVQAFCASPPSSLASVCADTTTPVAEAVTRSDGWFQLMLPDPGVTP